MKKLTALEQRTVDVLQTLTVREELVLRCRFGIGQKWNHGRLCKGGCDAQQSCRAFLSLWGRPVSPPRLVQ